MPELHYCTFTGFMFFMSFPFMLVLLALFAYVMALRLRSEDLIAALKEARWFIERGYGEDARIEIERIEAALRKAGEL